MHGLFTCSNSPNVEARASAILVGTSKQLLLQPFEPLQMVMSATVQPKCRTYVEWFVDLQCRTTISNLASLEHLLVQ